MRAGKLDRRITVQRAETTTDDFGADIETWEDVATVWAQQRPNRGAERFSAQQVAGSNVLTFHIRYLAGLTTRDRVIYNNFIFNIKDVREIGRRVVTEFDAVASEMQIPAPRIVPEIPLPGIAMPPIEASVVGQLRNATLSATGAHVGSGTPIAGTVIRTLRNATLSATASIVETGTPVVESVTVEPEFAEAGVERTITIAATDPEGLPLIYEVTVDGVPLEESATPGVFIWNG